MTWLILLIAFVSNSQAYFDPSDIQQKFERQDFKGGEINFSPQLIPSEKQEQKATLFKRSWNFSNTLVASDYRFRDTAVKRQFGGTCSTFGLLAAMENALHGQRPVDLSEKHLWNKYRKYSSERAVRAALNKGPVTDEVYWPMKRWLPKWGYKKNAKSYLKAASYIESDVGAAVSALSQGRPVYLGLQVTESMYACDAVIDPNSPSSGGGHAVAIVGHQLNESVAGGGYFIIKNSWSDQCGDHGYQYLPFNYCTREDLYCIMWDIQAVGVKN
jgi:C1A family cysteine protease